MIAVSITAEEPEGALRDIAEANAIADVIELRLDFLREVNEEILRELLGACKKPVIVAYRKQNFGASVEDVERGFILRKAVDAGVGLVDLDLSTDKRILQALHGNMKNSNLIVSFHDFKGTPPKEKLLNILQKEIDAGADVLKIVTTARSDKDNETVLSLIPAAKEMEKRIIAFCMGERGKSSRAECLRRGAFLTFASLGSGKESAPGQVSVQKLKKMLAGEN
ncbi:MAG: type I 3-dehydroquinate dehydratase [Candidatus Diapherotrites archaeon]|nr:type I 3-dehydroquinate dehydratase [Candidatus Diapherotrites archaeon]